MQPTPVSEADVAAARARVGAERWSSMVTGLVDPQPSDRFSVGDIHALNAARAAYRPEPAAPEVVPQRPLPADPWTVNFRELVARGPLEMERFRQAHPDVFARLQADHLAQFSTGRRR